MSRKKGRNIRLIRVSPLQAKMLGIPPNSTEVRKEEKDMTMNQKQNRDSLHANSMGAFAILQREMEGSAMAAENAKQEAIASQQSESKSKYNRLRNAQRDVLRDYIKNNITAIVGLTSQEVSDRFNDEVASLNPAVFDRLSNCYSVNYLLGEFGLGTLNYRIVIRSKDSPANQESKEPESVAQEEPVQPARLDSPVTFEKPTAVTMYRAADGSLHETREDAQTADQASELGTFIHQYCALHEFDAKQLAVSILKSYTVTKKV